MDDALDAADARLAGQRPSRLPTDRAHKMTIQGEEMMLFRNVRPATPSGKVELARISGVALERAATWRPVAPHHPLTLISPASDERITSTFGGVREDKPVPAAGCRPWTPSAPPFEPARACVDDLGEVHCRWSRT